MLGVALSLWLTIFFFYGVLINILVGFFSKVGGSGLNTV
jgi:hypothetical protein